MLLLNNKLEYEWFGCSIGSLDKGMMRHDSFEAKLSIPDLACIYRFNFLVLARRIWKKHSFFLLDTNHPIVTSSFAWLAISWSFWSLSYRANISVNTDRWYITFLLPSFSFWVYHASSLSRHTNNNIMYSMRYKLLQYSTLESKSSLVFFT